MKAHFIFSALALFLIQAPASAFATKLTADQTLQACFNWYGGIEHNDSFKWNCLNRITETNRGPENLDEIEAICGNKISCIKTGLLFLKKFPTQNYSTLDYQAGLAEDLISKYQYKQKEGYLPNCWYSANAMNYLKEKHPDILNLVDFDKTGQLGEKATVYGNLPNSSQYGADLFGHEIDGNYIGLSGYVGKNREGELTLTCNTDDFEDDDGYATTEYACNGTLVFKIKNYIQAVPKTEECLDRIPIRYLANKEKWDSLFSAQQKEQEKLEAQTLAKITAKQNAENAEIDQAITGAQNNKRMAR